MDDTVLWADSIKEAFNQVCSYLTLVGKNGIVMNPAKFVFAEKTVEFAGFTITADSVRPSPTYLEGIKNFPPPRDITGARSFFGLVNQASYAFSMKECMQPFRHLLKKGVKFEWNPELQRSFDEAKQHIIDLVEEGVRIFDMSKPTCLATDWCRQGVLPSGPEVMHIEAAASPASGTIFQSLAFAHTRDGSADSALKTTIA